MLVSPVQWQASGERSAMHLSMHTRIRSVSTLCDSSCVIRHAAPHVSIHVLLPIHVLISLININSTLVRLCRKWVATMTSGLSSTCW